MKQQSYIRAIESLQTERKAITDILSYLDAASFSKAIDILSSSSHIMTCASGSSGIAARKFAHSLCCIDKSAMFMPPCEAAHGGLGALKPGDVLVMVSRSGKTTELLPIIKTCGKRKAILIAVTENLDSPLAKAADVVIPLIIEKEADKFNLMATASFVATIAMFDAILAAIMEETGYEKEQFYAIHPDGTADEMLNA